MKRRPNPVKLEVISIAHTRQSMCSAYVHAQANRYWLLFHTSLVMHACLVFRFMNFWVWLTQIANHHDFVIQIPSIYSSTFTIMHAGKYLFTYLGIPIRQLPNSEWRRIEERFQKRLLLESKILVLWRKTGLAKFRLKQPAHVYDVLLRDF